jgi:thioredoxin 1
MGNIEEIVSFDRLDEVMTANEFVVVKFWAQWCGPCRMLSPVFDGVASERNDAVFVKVNVDDAPDIASAYCVSSVPMIILFSKKEEINSFSGSTSKSKLIELINECKTGAAELMRNRSC